MSKTKRRTSKPAVQPIPTTQAIDVPLNRLRLSDSNVRTIYDPAAIADLAESIAHRGLLQPLGVRAVADTDGNQTGDYEVNYGGRRFRAFEKLLKEKRIEPGAPIHCVLKDTGLAEDDSLAENSDRVQLHPIDEFRAFQAMIDKGKSEADVAAAYRVTIHFVRQRLMLAAASPVILKAFQKDEMDLEQLMAFCVVNDHKRQNAVWKALTHNWDKGAHTIRRMLTEGKIPANDARVRFVGLDVYEAAGGPDSVLRDLFDNRNEGYINNPELLNQLVADKLETIRLEHVRQGWKWAEAAPTFTHGHKQGMDRLIGTDVELTFKEQKRLEKLTAERDKLSELDELTDEQDARCDELDADIQALENKPPVYDADDMARAGVFITIGNSGELSVDAGYIRAEDRIPDPEDDTAPHANGHAHNGSANGEETDETARPISGSVTEDLTSYRTVALRNGVAQDFNIAFVSILHVLALSHYYHSTGMSCVQVKLDTSFVARAPGLDPWPATKAIANRDLAWKKLLPQKAVDLWQALLDMEPTTRQGLFAHLASLGINAVKSPHVPRAEAHRHADKLAHALGLDMVEAGWTTTAENYLGRVTKDHIVQAVREAKGDDTAALIADLKKDRMVTEAERLLRGSGWLPAALRAPDPSASSPDADRDDEAELPAFLEDTGEGDADSAAA